jgi:hypothetical protein
VWCVHMNKIINLRVPYKAIYSSSFCLVTTIFFVLFLPQKKHHKKQNKSRQIDKNPSFVVDSMCSNLLRIPNLMYVVVGLAPLYDPESYAGGSVAAGRASHAGNVKAMIQTKRDTLVLQAGCWAKDCQPRPVKSLSCWKAFKNCSRTGTV